MTKDDQQARMNICRACEYCIEGRTCAVCNCPLQAKTWKADFCCPIGKWPALAAPQLL